MYRSIVLVGLLLLLSGAFHHAVGEGPCEMERVQWANSFDALKNALDDYRRIKDESVTPKINEIVTKTSRYSIASAIQTALKARADRMAEAENLCQETAARERVSYDAWRRCGGQPQQRKNLPPQFAPGSVSRERDRLIAELHDLLLDEAYAQYKGQAATPVNGYGPEPSEQRGATREPRDDRWMGYRGQAPANSNPWSAYQGYYR